ncbi:MAG: DNA translocase FtsK [Saccharofermentans sp.]|nr:DNA translocase FtsK [Saccharofermentans sp.]
MKRSEEHNEITALVLFFVAILFVLIVFTDWVGGLGSAIRSFLMGLIGSTAYVLPLFLLYAAIDLFFEKRLGVSKIRIKSVVMFLLGVSAFLAICSMDFTYFESLLFSPEGKIKATAALSLLYKSGSDASLITNVTSSANCIPGGLLGGGIAVALENLISKTGGIILLAFYLVLLVITVFHISLKKTAKAIGGTAKTVYTNAQKTRRRQAANRYRVYSNEDTRRPAPARRSAGRGTTVISYDNKQPSPFVNPAPATGPNANVDPFGSTLPIDRSTGFTDLSSMGLDTHSGTNPGTITYDEREYAVTDSHPKADFGYKTDPLNIPRANRPKQKTLSFLDNTKEDFIDLTPEADKVIEPEEEPVPEDPYEVDTEDYNGSGYDYDRSVRTPFVDPNLFGGQQTPAPMPVSAPAPAPQPSAPDEEGYDQYEGRILKANDAQKQPAGADIDYEGKTIRRKADKARNYYRYKPAPTSLLAPDSIEKKDPQIQEEIERNKRILIDTLQKFGINSEISHVTRGPVITRYEITIDAGTKVSKVTGLRDDIMLAMAAISVRIEAPIPGKSAIGIEIPNKKASAVQLRSLVETPEFRKSPPLNVAIGRDIPGKPMYCNLAKMPHLMIAGSTGSGKSVCINSMLSSILVHSSPAEVRMILIDPKVVELSMYNGIPHLISPVITNPKMAAGSLRWAVEEMGRRYKLFEEAQVRDITGFNEKCDQYRSSNNAAANEVEKLPYILIVIDELAELMMVAAKEVEAYISRLAALARACGIHLLIATQRPSVDVITGVIKANIGSRIALAVSSQVDSRTILDKVGAENLLGKGDMLYAPMTAMHPTRGQGSFLKDSEVEALVEWLNNRYGTDYDEDIIKEIKEAASSDDKGNLPASSSGDEAKGASAGDILFNQAVDVVLENNAASISILQRRLGIGYPRAARLVDELEKKKIIGPPEGSKPRKILINRTEWLEIQARSENE